MTVQVAVLQAAGVRGREQVMLSAWEVTAAAVSLTSLSWRRRESSSREPALKAACSWRWKEAGRGPWEAWVGTSAWRDPHRDGQEEEGRGARS